MIHYEFNADVIVVATANILARSQRIMLLYGLPREAYMQFVVGGP